MRPTINHGTIVAFLLLATSTAKAVPAEPAPHVPIAPALPAAAYVDQATLLIAQIDVTALDVDAMHGWLMALLTQGGLPKQDLDAVRAHMTEGAGPLKGMLADLVKAGGKRVYVLVSSRNGAPILAVFPVAGDGEAASMVKFLSPGGGLPADLANGTTAEKAGGVVLFGPAAAVKAAKETAAEPHAPRPDLAAAFAAAGNAPVKAAFSIPEQLKGAIIIHNPTLPPELGGRLTAPILNSFKYASLALTPPTAGSAKFQASLMVQARDAAGAEKLGTLTSKLIATASNQMRRDNAADNLLALVTPKVAADKLTVDVDQGTFEKSSKALVAAVVEQLAVTRRMTVLKSLKQIMTASYAYANEHQGSMPRRLPDDIAPYVGGASVAQRLFPINPQGKPELVYIRQADKFSQIQNDGECIVIYEAYDKWPAGGIGAGFADGHAEWFFTETEFKKALSAK